MCFCFVGFAIHVSEPRLRNDPFPSVSVTQMVDNLLCLPTCTLPWFCVTAPVNMAPVSCSSLGNPLSRLQIPKQDNRD